MTADEQTDKINADARDVLAQWHRGIRLLHVAHAKAAAHFQRRGRMLGVPVVVLTAIVGTSIFATISDEAVSGTWKIVAGLISFLAAILSALQTFLNYEIIAEKHRIADVAFGALRRDLERSLDSCLLEPKDRAVIMKDIGERWNQLEREAPVVPDYIHRLAARQVGLPQERDV